MSNNHSSTTPDRGRLDAVFALLALVPKLLHEVSHAVVGAPFAHEVRVCVRPGEFVAYCDIEFEAETPSWGVWLAFLAPFILGTAFIAAGTAYALLYGVPLPDTVSDWLWAGILGVWWTIYAYPSPSDRTGAHNVIQQLNTDTTSDSTEPNHE